MSHHYILNNLHPKYQNMQFLMSFVLCLIFFENSLPELNISLYFMQPC